jgi:hypothetical protein
MPRMPRGQQAGYGYHVIDRGNAPAAVIHNRRTILAREARR